MSIDKKEEQIIQAFAAALKKRREPKGMSQEALAHAISSHFTHISRLENGHKQPTLVMLFKLAEELGVRPSSILEEMESEL